MRFPVQIQALAGHSVALDAGGLGRASLHVDGRIYKSAKKVFTVERPGQPPVEVHLKSRFFDPVPNLEVEGELLEVAPPLKWYEYAWCCIPMLLIALGGAIGGATGGAASFANVTVFRSVQNAPLRYLLAGAISGAALITYLLLAVGITLLSGRL